MVTEGTNVGSELRGRDSEGSSVGSGVGSGVDVGSGVEVAAGSTLGSGDVVVWGTEGGFSETVSVEGPGIMKYISISIAASAAAPMYIGRERLKAAIMRPGRLRRLKRELLDRRLYSMRTPGRAEGRFIPEEVFPETDVPFAEAGRGAWVVSEGAGLF